jgi:AsmA protein
VEFDFELVDDMLKNSGVLRSGQIHIGNASVSLTGTYVPDGDSAGVNLDLAGPEMPVPQLAAMLPAFGIVLPAGSSLQGGTASAKLSLAGPLEALVVAGSLGLSNTRLAGFDLGSKLSRIEKLAGIRTGPDTEIRTFTTTVHLAPDGASVQDILFVAPALGELRGGGTVRPSDALDFKMRARLYTAGAGVAFAIEGTAANPVFRPDVKATVGQALGLRRPPRPPIHAPSH